MENKDKIEHLEKKLLNEPNMTEEEYNQTLVDLCKEIEKGPSKNITKEFLEMTERLGI